MKPFSITAESDFLITFSTALGWMAIRTGARTVRRLSFGHKSAAAAARAIGVNVTSSQKLLPWQKTLIELLRAFAEGAPVDFSGIPIDFDGSSHFRRHVWDLCRKVAYGQTITYGQLAAKAGAPGAARAVGTCMARNPLPLIIPCHRIVRAGGVIGPYSAVGGTKTKRHLLEMESHQLLR
jgi:methylated-DNA-[protein]-cysteine S-methyltransferase